MKSNMANRIAALEARSRPADRLASLTDEELMQRILRLHLGRGPTPDELHEWMTLPAAESERRCQEMLLAARRQLQNDV